MRLRRPLREGRFEESFAMTEETAPGQSGSSGFNVTDSGSTCGVESSQCLEVIVTQKADRACVALKGEFDGATAELVKVRLTEIATTCTGDLELDVGMLNFPDGRGLSVLLALHQELAEHGKSLVITAPTASARRLFEITRLNQILRIEPVRRPRRWR
jgi:anti-anti-sigma factor